MAAAAAGRPTQPVLSQCAHASRSFASDVPAVSCRDVNLSVDDAQGAAKKGKRCAPGRRVQWATGGGSPGGWTGERENTAGNDPSM